MNVLSAPARAAVRTFRQRSIRSHSGSVSLEDAVCYAADLLFCFTYRSSRCVALWSDTEHVWLGSETFLYWALCDYDIDIPWVVATASDAPRDADDLRKAVRAELSAYWANKTANLPRTQLPRWMPLP